MRLLFPACIALLFGARPISAAEGRTTENFDRGWLFHSGDLFAAGEVEFPDGDWVPVVLPHDWSVGGPFAEQNPTGAGGGFLPAGIGWYRKHFKVPTSDANRRLFIEFDGVVANSDVLINGSHLGHRPSGSAGFSYELTPFLRPGAELANVLAVRVDDSRQPASRWAPGAGIDRHVRLISVEPVHWDDAAFFVTTPRVAADRCVVRVAAEALNALDSPADLSAAIVIYGPNAQAVARETAPVQRVAAHGQMGFSLDLDVPRPELWEPGRGKLYRASISLLRDGHAVADRTSVLFGIREIRFDPATGLNVNGRAVKLKGVCLHGDVSALGSAAPLSAWRRRLEVLRELGVNAIRTAHNPPDPGFLDLCDSMGFLVMDEFFDCWTVGKEPYDYHLDFDLWSATDARAALRRDRNHPSVILWSVGNEIHDTPNARLAHTILQELVRICHENDPTRPVTQALFRPNVSHDYDNGLADLLDVVGTNYRFKELLAAHQAKPSRRIVGTENGHERDAWLAVRDHPEYSGEFVWCGIDYLGEAHAWPAVSSNSGLVDRTGVPKPVGWEFASWWSDHPMVRAFRRTGRTPPRPTDPANTAPARYPQVLFGDWSPADRNPHEETLEVYSNCQLVSVLLNGRRMGEEQPRPADLAPRVWRMPFEPGTLEVVGKNGARQVARDVLATAGPATRIRLEAESSQLRSDWDSIGYVSATVVDAAGVPVPADASPISFSISGPGSVAAVDSADARSHEPFQALQRRAYQGRCWALVRATGTGILRLTAASAGLASGSVEIGAIAADIPSNPP